MIKNTYLYIFFKISNVVSKWEATGDVDNYKKGGIE
jgi:hypothetical protein